jgi:hypothetical protein
MAIATRTDLLTKGASWLRRAGNATFVAELPDALTLAEGRLNRELGPVETNASLTGTVDSRSLDTSALSMVEPVALFMAASGSEDEVKLQPQGPANMAYVDTSGQPRQWTLDSDDAIKLDRPCDSAYAFRFRYRQRFALTTLVTTNWLLLTYISRLCSCGAAATSKAGPTDRSGRAFSTLNCQRLPTRWQRAAKAR